MRRGLFGTGIIANAFLAGISLFGLASTPLAVSQGNVPQAPRRQGRYKLGGRWRSRYWPHQGKQEIARRKRQIDEGRLQITGESDLMRTIRLTRKGIERVLGEEAA